MTRILDIEICKWDEFNPKRDQKSYTWLRLNNDILTDPKLFGLDAEQKLCWIEILCQASKKSEGRVKINPDQIAYVAQVKASKVDALIEFLVAAEVVVVHDNARPHVVVDLQASLQNSTPTNVTNERTDERAEPELEPAGSDSVAPAPFAEILKTKKVSEEVQRSWIETYEDPGWIEFELKKAITWTLAHKSRAPKSNFAKFFSGWLSRSWESHRKTIPIAKAANHDSFCGIGVR